MLQAGYIVPHPPLLVHEVGGGRESECMDTLNAYTDIAKRISVLKPETIVFISPHADSYADCFCIGGTDNPGGMLYGDFGSFGVPGVRFSQRWDDSLAQKLQSLAREQDFPAEVLLAGPLDHGCMVPLYFINQFYKNYKMLRISISGLTPQEHFQMGTILKQAIEASGKKTVIISSGDLSHKLKEDGPYGLAPEGHVFDQKIINVMKSGDLSGFMGFESSFCQKAAECGLRSFVMLSGALKDERFSSRFLSYEGTFGVGYAICEYMMQDTSAEYIDASVDDSDSYVSLARQTIETYVKTGDLPEMVYGISEQDAEAMKQKRAGVFVSIKKHGQLRGCIGTISAACDDVMTEIMANAVSASTRDPRFNPITEDELPYLKISVDELMPAEKIVSRLELDVKRYGVIVTSGRRRGLLLPNLEGVDTIDEQVVIALQKAGISPAEDYEMERFEVIRHE